MLKVAVVTCYKDPDYVRSRSLRAALQLVPGVSVIEVKNTRPGLFARIPEVMYRLLQVRTDEQPDVYLLTFRGYELLWFVLLLAGKKPVIFDEFIQPVEVVSEHRHMKGGSTVGRLMGIWIIMAPLYYWMLARCAHILADTEAHADYSAGLSQVERSKYLALPVGTDEALFRPAVVSPKPSAMFQVFYYGNMLPLHGVRYVIEAAEKLKDRREITFVLVGGDKSVETRVQRAVKNGARIDYRPRVPFEDIPSLATSSQLCLGGPFGDTVQSHNVITGKTYQFIACAVPTVIGKSKATDAYFVDKQNCLLVQQASSDALTQAIVWAYDNPEQLAAIGREGRKLYERQFSAKQIARLLRRIMLPLVREAVNDPPSAK